ncbi:hypothetical protein Syun_027936 [Stephania yunnanensis]|uniref:Uncharacterized protein n=1 Tax=Stephania yunnanensis TaxID=152371 RepID=A0AAP0EGG4_9MAGN
MWFSSTSRMGVPPHFYLYVVLHRPPAHNRLVIAMINDRNIHWLRVKLSTNAPLPSLYPSWVRYVQDSAKGWRDRFVFRDIAPIATLLDATISVVDLGTP